MSVEATELDRCERLLTACTCHPAFAGRKRRDPECEACNLGVEIIDTFRAMRAELEALRSRLAKYEREETYAKAAAKLREWIEARNPTFRPSQSAWERQCAAILISALRGGE